MDKYTDEEIVQFASILCSVGLERLTLQGSIIATGKYDVFMQEIEKRNLWSSFDELNKVMVGF